MGQQPHTIYILGSGAFANELKSYIEQTYKCIPTQFVDDHTANGETIITMEDYHNRCVGDNCKSIMGAGHPHIKLKMHKEIVGTMFTYIAETAWISDDASYGFGCVIAPNAVVAPCAHLGDHVLINYGAIISHDCIIGDLSTISPGATICGCCTIGQSVYVGANAAIKEGLSIGGNTLVGIGAVVRKDVPPNSVVIGNSGMVFDKNEWPTIAQRMSSNIKHEKEQLRKADH